MMKTQYVSGLFSDLSSKWHVPLDAPNYASGLVTVIKSTRIGSSYEILTRSLDITNVRMFSYPEKVKRIRKETDFLTDEDLRRSVKRSRQCIRYLIKSSQCDRLLTFTVQETDNFLSFDEIKKVWRNFIQNILPRNGFDLKYVCVFEKHKKGNFHIHASVIGYVKLKILSRLWKAALKKYGKNGNVNLKYRSDLNPVRRAQGMAKYLSKYVGKNLTDVSVKNKKRYFTNITKDVDVRYYITKDLHGLALLDEVIRLHSFSTINTLNLIHYIDFDNDVFYIDNYLVDNLKEIPF